MNWKNLIITVLAALLPVIYALIADKNPGLPIDQTTFINLIMFIVAGVAGWQITKVRK